MTRVVIAGAEHASAISHQVELWGHVVTQLAQPVQVRLLPLDAEVLVIEVGATPIPADLIPACDTLGVRVVAVITHPEHWSQAAGFGIVCIDLNSLAAELPNVLTGAMRGTARSRPRTGTLLAFWGAHGAPGTSTIALNVAAEAAMGAGTPRTCLIDLDCWAPAVAPLLGQVSEIPGVAAAARLADAGELTEIEFERLSMSGPGTMRVLSGLTALNRWSELTPERVSALLESALQWFDLVVVDAGSHALADEIEIRDPFAPRRSAAAEAAATRADVLIGVGAADPLGLARLIRAWPNWSSGASAQPTLVINRLRRRAVGFHAEQQVRRTCEDFLGCPPLAVLPEDHAATDRALRAGATLSRVAPKSPLRSAIVRLATELTGLDRAEANSRDELTLPSAIR